MDGVTDGATDEATDEAVRRYIDDIDPASRALSDRDAGLAGRTRTCCRARPRCGCGTTRPAPSPTTSFASWRGRRLIPEKSHSSNKGAPGLTRLISLAGAGVPCLSMWW